MTWVWQLSVAGSAADIYDPNDPFYLVAQGSDHIPSQIYHDLYAATPSAKILNRQSARLGASLTDGLKVEVGISMSSTKSPPMKAYYQPFIFSPFGDLV